jgi:hypothetical protein
MECCAPVGVCKVKCYRLWVSCTGFRASYFGAVKILGSVFAWL